MVASAIVDKYIGESARVIREMFGYAKDHQPCVIFMDEVDAIGGRRFSQGKTSVRVQPHIFVRSNHAITPLSPPTHTYKHKHPLTLHPQS